MNLSTKFAVAASTAAAAAAAAIVIPTAFTNASPAPAVPADLPIAALRSAPSLPSVAADRSAVLTAAQAVQVDPTTIRQAGPGVWAAQRADRGVCLFVADPAQGMGAVCKTEEATRANGVWVEARKGDDVSRVGLVPDGYTTAVAQSASGAPVAKAAVSGNVYRISGTDISNIEVTGAAGKPNLDSSVDR